MASGRTTPKLLFVVLGVGAIAAAAFLLTTFMTQTPSTLQGPAQTPATNSIGGPQAIGEQRAADPSPSGLPSGRANAEPASFDGWDLRLFDLGGGETIYIAYVDQDGAPPALGVGCADGEAPMMLVRPSGEDDTYKVEAVINFSLDDGRSYTADASFFPPEFFLQPSDRLLRELRGDWVEIRIDNGFEGRLTLKGAEQAIGDALAGCR